MQTFLRRCFFLLTLTLCSVAATAQTCALPGWNGPVTITGGSNFINSYHGGSGSPVAGATSISTASATGQRNNTRQLLAGDMILIIQMQDSSNGTNAGLHEYAQIASITGTAITLTKALTNSYNQVMNTTNVRNWQVVWVPQYSALTVTGTASANTWTINAATGVGTGGVLALDVAGSLALNGTVTASGMGFRGSMGLSGTATITGGTATTANRTYDPTSPLTRVGGQKGEGTEGTPPVVFTGSLAGVTYTALLGQGYALGAGGLAAIGNAGGGANDGNPATSHNSYNAGGGGGGNSGTGGHGGNSWNDGTNTAVLNGGTVGQTGNDAGGKGGNPQSNGPTRLVMGGGGGAGSVNNSSATNAITAWPPTAVTTGSNGATGAITSSGASGGGIVLIRTGSISGAGRILTSGLRAYNKFQLTDTDSAGGGGAGGSVFVTAGSGNGTGMTIDASGGDGGLSNYYQHGPGGGGGGGYIFTNLGAATTDITGGASGTDACCGVTGAGATGGAPKKWNAEDGFAGAVVTSGSSPAGLGGGGGACLPNIAVTKSTSTPSITATTGATARYSINLTNSGGGASNVFIFDAALPPNWVYTSASAIAYAYDPAPGGAVAANAAAAGAESVTATAPGAFPVNSVTRANSITAVTLRAAATAAGVTPTNGANTPTFGSFYLPSDGSLTVSFTVTIPNSATVGSYHNPAGVIFLDPTRITAATERMVSPATNINANRGSVSYSGQTTYESGGTTNVAGSNYSGLAAGPSTEDVTLQPDLSVVKTKSTNTFTLGVTGLSYIIAVRNSGRTVTHQIFANTQATSQSGTAIIGSPAISDTMPPGMSITSVTDTDANWTCTVGAGSTTFTCSVADADFPWNTNSNLVTITATISLSFPACPGPQINTVSVTTTTFGDAVPSNNAGTVTTPIGCSTNLTVTKTNAVSSVKAGGTTSYTITFANLGPATGDGSTVLDDPSDGLECAVVSCTPGGTGVCPAPASWTDLVDTGLTLTSFAAGSTLTFLLSCTVTATGK